MRILLLSHYFHPEPYFLLPLAEELVRRGHSVEVLTGFPNYPEGKIYEGYRQRLWFRETINGIPIIRVPLYPNHDRSSLKRIFSYTSLALSKALLGSFLIQKPDVVYVTQGPATIGLPACICKWLRGAPFIYHIQDLWPDSLASTGMFSNQTGIRLVHKWCDFIYSQAARIVVLAPGMKRCLVERGVAEEKVDVVYNWADETNLHGGIEHDEALAEKLGMTAKFNIVFAGNMGKAQGLDTVLDAAALLRDQIPNLQFVLVGDGVEKERLRASAKQRGLTNVIFHPFQPASEIGRTLRLADALLIHLKNDPLFQMTIPSKTQAYLAMGRPILVGVGGDAEALVKEAGAGVSCIPGDAESMAAAASKLYHMSQAERDKAGLGGASYYRECLSFKQGVDRLENLFDRTVTLPTK